MPRDKMMAAVALAMSLMVCTFFYVNLDKGDQIRIDKDGPNDEHWHRRYVEDSCKRCPECCIRTVGDEFIDPYGVKRPSEWLPLECDPQLHCKNCPSEDCVCIKGPNGCWVIGPEAGE